MQASHPEPNAGLAETKIRARLDGLGGNANADDGRRVR
jgi:hypothetical protein